MSDESVVKKLYKDIISQSKEVIAAIELPFKVKKEAKQLEMKILELEQQIAKDELTIQEQKSKCPVDWNKVIECVDTLELNNRKLGQLNDLQIELFGA